MLGFNGFCCFGLATGSLLSAASYLNRTCCPVSLPFSTTYPLLLLLAPAKPASDNSSLCLLLSSGLLRTFARAPHNVCMALVDEEFYIGTLITEGPGAEQEIQVLFLHKHFQFGLAEYLDTNSLWVGIPWVYLSSYVPVFKCNDSLTIITVVEKILIHKVQETILCSISTETKKTIQPEASLTNSVYSHEKK